MFDGSHLSFAVWLSPVTSWYSFLSSPNILGTPIPETRRLSHILAKVEELSKRYNREFVWLRGELLLSQAIVPLDQGSPTLQ